MSLQRNPGRAAKPSGKDSKAWKGGASRHDKGYILVHQPGHHRASKKGYVYEHILVAEQKEGRPIRRHEPVHHLNEVRDDNRPENLKVMPSKAAHMKEHGINRWMHRRVEPMTNPIVSCACGCGQTFARFDSRRRPRQFVSGHNPTFRWGQGTYFRLQEQT